MDLFIVAAKNQTLVTYALPLGEAYAMNKCFSRTFSPNFIDSKEVFRACFFEKSNFSVAALCREFSIVNSRPHRAGYDAEATALVLKIAFDKCGWTSCISDLRSKMNMEYKTAPDYKCTLIATNSNGVHRIYKMILDAHTQYFYIFPRMQRKIIEENREAIFVVGSTARDGEIYNKYFFDCTPMNTVLSFYDYIHLLTPALSSVNEPGYEVPNYVVHNFYQEIYDTAPHKCIATSAPKYLFHYESEVTKILRYHFGNARGKASGEFFIT